MTTLKDRLEEVMAHMGWEHRDLARVSGESSSVVSQWLGKGSKEIKTIGRVSTAIRLEHASGFSATWIAEGTGPKKPGSHNAREPEASYITTQVLLAQLRHRLEQLRPDLRPAVGDILSAWARDPGGEDRSPALLALLSISEKRQDAA